MQIKKPTSELIDNNKALENFLLNAHLYTPEQRTKIIEMLHFLIMPQHIVRDRLPIEEEFIQTHGMISGETPKVPRKDVKIVELTE